MRMECSMNKRKRRYFSPEFKAEAVRLCRVGDRTVAKVARDLDLTTSVLRDWVKQADVDGGKGAPGELTTAERNELSELRKRVQRLEMEREILKKAAAFFAKENT
jgi:transposase-like protein